MFRFYASSAPPSLLYRNVMLKFCFNNSTQRECFHEVPLPQLRSGCNVMAKCHFRNSAQKGMFREVPLLQSHCVRECHHEVPLPQSAMGNVMV